MFCIQSKILLISSVIPCWELPLHAAGFWTPADSRAGMVRRECEEEWYCRWGDGEENKFGNFLLSKRGTFIWNRRANWHALRNVKIERTSMSRTILKTEVQCSRMLAFFLNLHFHFVIFHTKNWYVKLFQLFMEPSRILYIRMKQNGLCNHHKRRSHFVTVRYSIAYILRGSIIYRFIRGPYMF